MGSLLFFLFFVFVSGGGGEENVEDGGRWPKLTHFEDGARLISLRGSACRPVLLLLFWSFPLYCCACGLLG